MAPKYSILGYDFSNKRVLVTGGGGGIGKAIATTFLELNAQVFLLDKDVELVNALTAEYPGIHGIVVDLQNWEETRETVKSVLPIHHLANNAGICVRIPFLDIDVKHIDSIFDVNFKAAINVAQVVAKGMIEHGITDGTIVNMGSITDSKRLGIGTTAVYSASKAALAMLTKTMAVELASHGIRVNSVRPAIANTEIVAKINPERLEPILQRMLFHQTVEPIDIAHSVVFLSSPFSSQLTASAITIDQGYTAQ